MGVIRKNNIRNVFKLVPLSSIKALYKTLYKSLYRVNISKRAFYSHNSPFFLLNLIDSWQYFYKKHDIVYSCHQNDLQTSQRNPFLAQILMFTLKKVMDWWSDFFFCEWNIPFDHTNSTYSHMYVKYIRLQSVPDEAGCCWAVLLSWTEGSPAVTWHSDPLLPPGGAPRDLHTHTHTHTSMRSLQNMDSD